MLIGTIEYVLGLMFEVGGELFVGWGASVWGEAGVDTVVGVFSILFLTFWVVVGVIEADGDGDFEIVVDSVVVGLSTGLFVLVADHGKILLAVMITTVIKVVILVVMIWKKLVIRSFITKCN